jgi:hypothetical protein
MSTKIGTTTLKSSSRIPLNKKRISKKERSYQTGSSSMCSLLHRKQERVPPSPCKKKCEILLQKPMKKRSAVILVNWGEIVEKKLPPMVEIGGSVGL